MIVTVISIVVFIIVIVLHECAHGYVAHLMGDNTARDAGRLTLNPIRHADPMGTVLLPIMLVMMHSPIVFGWAKPVPVNPRNFKDPRKGMLLTSLAGPGANIALALIFAIIFKTGFFPADTIFGIFLIYGIIISLILGVFNMIPIPPLDGSNVLMAILPIDMARKYMKIERYGFIILIVLLFLGVFDRVIIPIVNEIMKILLG